MKKNILLSLIFIVGIISHTLAQNPARVTIKGVIQDTNANPAGFAVVMLLSPKDSTLQNYVQTNENGQFSFNNVRNTDYLLKVSHISFLPLQISLPAHPTNLNDLGNVSIKPIAAELMEVVIRTAKAPLSIRGDTIEYDATTFKVPPGSTVEDLLKRLPGIEVDGDGNIKTQGKDVKRLYVDGKAFFGDDPKSATKNLDAEAISKVQVFNEKSEQSQLTGVDDGNREKAMNLQLKEAYKKGSFGKVTVAGGTSERWAGRGNYNRFNANNQLSFIGFANNINETGVNWEDYGEFKGQNAFSQFDNGDFGFSGSGNRYFGNNDDAVPSSYFNGAGFTKNYGAGANYNYDNTKVKFNTSYFYNYTRLNYQRASFQETFLSASSFFDNDTTDFVSGNGNHRVSSRIEYNIDSNNKFVAKANFRYTDSRTDNLSNDWFVDDLGNPLNWLSSDNTTISDSWRLNATAIYNHKFKKKGRSFAISGGYNQTPSGEDKQKYSYNYFFDISPYTSLLRQENHDNQNKQQYKASTIYTEPLSKIFFFEIFYNFAYTDNRVNRQAYDPGDGGIRVDSLSVYYTNQIMYNRIGTSVRFAKNGLNIMLGLAGQQLDLGGEYSRDKGDTLLTNPVDKTFQSLSPKFTLNYEFPNGIWFSMDYGYSISEPSFTDLQPIPIISNQNYRSVGNPDLQPSGEHSASLNLYYHNRSSFASLNFGADYNYTYNDIAYNKKIEWVEGLGYVTTTKPDNTGEGQQISSWLWSSIPLVKTKLSMSVSESFWISQNKAFVNEDANITNYLSSNSGLKFSFTPIQKLIIELGGNLRYRNIQYSISTDQNQKIYEYGGSLTTKWEFISKTYLEANFDYSLYQNSVYDYNEELPVLNASVRRLLGKKNQFQIRLAAFDIFNKLIKITQSGGGNYTQRTITPTLARYFMLSFSYNIKGFESKLKKERFW